MWHRKFLFILVVTWLIGVSLFPRVVEVLNNNFIFLLDMGRDYMAVKNIVVNQKPTLIGAEVGVGMAGLNGLFHGPFYFYLLSIPFVLFQGDPYGGLLLMFFFGILTIVVGFLLGKKILGILGGMLMAFLIALSPPIIAQSRFIWNPHPASLFILLAFYFVYLSFDKKKLHLFLGSFFTGFVYNFQTAMAVPMSFAVFFYMLFLLRRKLILLFFVLAGFIVGYSPLLVFEIKHGFPALRGLSNYFSRPADTAFKIDFSPFLHNFSDTFVQQGVIPSILILFVLVLGLIYFMFREKRKNIYYFIVFLGLNWIITVAIMSLIKTHIFEYYLIHLNFINMLLFCYIFVSAYKKRHNFFLILLTVFLGLFLFYGTMNSIQTTRKDLPDYGGMVKMRGKLDVIDYIYQDAKGEQFGLLIFSPPVYTYPYDYLIWWYGERKYGYLPHQEKKGTFYLLIEKDLSSPWTYEGWLETVIKTGKIIDVKELSNGFIIQKRVNE